MKKVLTLLIAAGLLEFFAAPAAKADADFSAGIEIRSPADFYQPLAPLGIWVDLSPYGRCWHPRVVADWRPYEDGQWVWTDAGWYWQSDEPWSWACYHYGSWVDDDTYGWCWIPGTEWAPAWVTWRVSDDYIGWAPCGPDLSVLAPPLFVFVDIHHFHRHFHRRDFIVDNPTVINRTRVVNNITTEEVNVNGTPTRIAVNRGPGVDPIQRATGTRYRPRPIRDVMRQSRPPANFRPRTSQPQRQMQPHTRQYQPPRIQPRTAPAQQPPQVMPPTGRQQPRHREFQTPRAQPRQRALPPQVMPPTGREQSGHREFQTPRPEPRHRALPPQAPPQPARPVPREHPMPPTGRERQLRPPPPARPAMPPPRGAQPQPPPHPRKDQGQP